MAQEHHACLCLLLSLREDPQVGESQEEPKEAALAIPTGGFLKQPGVGVGRRGPLQSGGHESPRQKQLTFRLSIA